MESKFGSTLTPDDFDSPFNGIIAGFVNKGKTLRSSLEKYLFTEWKKRPLEIYIIDDVMLNAWAKKSTNCDEIIICRGTFEHIYGTILGLVSTPIFLPSIGNTKNETYPDNLINGRFSRIPMLKNASINDLAAPAFIPKDKTRMMLASILIELALEFLIYHELGHVLGGHLEIPLENKRLRIEEFKYSFDKPENTPFLYSLECDADNFAYHFTSAVHTNGEIAKDLCRLLNVPEDQSQDIALLTYLTAIGVLFRILYPEAPINIENYGSSHPHPAVRSCFIASAIMARGLLGKKYSVTSIKEILKQSVGNVETTWAALYLPGQNPESPVNWAKNVNDATISLIEAYINSKALLEQHTRTSRHWDEFS